MKKLLVSFLTILSLYSVHAQKIVGYLPSYRDPSTSNIQYAKVNTIIYAFINPSANGTLITTTGLGSAWDFDMTHFLTVKSNCATYGTKLSISVGGADAGNLRSTRLNDVSGNATYRATLVSQLVQFAITHNLYGIDVDWEFPTNATARTNHEALLSALRTAINASSNPNIKIGVAVGGEYTGSINHLNYFNSTAVQYVDDFHIMAYDFPASYDANNHASITDAQGSFNQWSSAKSIAKSKMYLGVPFYGRNPSRSAESDYRSFSAGAASYNVDNYSGYYYNGKTTLENKAQWVVDQGGQGIMIWDLGQDRTDTYSLLNVLYTKMSSICPAPQPDLGPDVGFCTGSVTLNSGVATATGRTFSWKKDGSYVVTNSATATTYTTSTGGTFIVEVTQSACTKTDQILVTAGSSLGVTNAVRCGTGSVTIGVNASSGTYDWYTASTGGTAVHTGLNYTFNETASNNYYVQENTGSATYSAGKAVINLPAAWNEAGYESTNSLPRFGHKIVVSTDLTIQSVKIWTSNNATNGVKVMITKADGTTVHDQTAAVNLATGGGPYTLTVNKTLVAGTYYVGVYAPVPGGAGNQGIYLESNSNYPTNQTGVYSISGMCYANYGTGFAATQTPTHYGQLFDWVITTGVVPPCGRTLVTTTINTGANTGLTVGSTSPICTGTDGTVTVQNSESNVSYQAYIGANTAGPAAYGNGGTLTLSVNSASLSVGANTITVKGTKTGCGTVNLTNTTSITVTSSSPTITFGTITKTYGDANFTLAATSNSSGALTYSFVSSTPTGIATVASNGLTSISGAGTATVQVSQAASGCYTASTANATITINKANRVVAITSSNAGTAGGSINLTYTTTPTGGTPIWSKTDGTGTANISGSTLSLLTTGTVTVKVDIAADANYNAATATQTITISNLATPTITFGNVTKTYGDAAFTVAATSNSTGALTYSFVNSVPAGIITVASNGQISINGAGTATVQVSQAAGGSYGAGSATATITINKANRTVSITSANSGVEGSTITLANTISAGTNTPYWTVTNGTGNATLSAGVLTLNNAGTVTVDLSVAADNNYNAASATQMITISTITAVTDAQSGASFTVYPNPYEQNASVHFELANSAAVKLEVYDLSGHKIQTLMNGAVIASGSYEVGLSDLSMGTYLVKLQVGSFEKNIKVVKH